MNLQSFKICAKKKYAGPHGQANDQNIMTRTYLSGLHLHRAPVFLL